MFEKIEDLKDFLSWAKTQKIQQLKIGEVEVAFHPLALVDGASFDPEENREAIEEIFQDEDEESILFHSSE